MSMEALFGLIITLIIAGLIFWLVLWFVDFVGVPEPFNKVIKVVLGIVALLYLLSVLTGYAPPIFVRR